MDVVTFALAKNYANTLALGGATPIPGPPGNPGQPGADGQSAYQIAVANGFIGSEQMWLASLQGQNGADGLPGQNGIDGQNGSDGQPGQNGKNGEGVPPGGTTNQILEKASNEDFDTRWVNKPAGGGTGNGDFTAAVAEHNTDTTAHEDIRKSIADAVINAGSLTPDMVYTREELDQLARDIIGSFDGYDEDTVAGFEYRTMWYVLIMMMQAGLFCNQLTGF